MDEAHGAAESSVLNKSQQQRHHLLQEISQNEKQHLILLTATPHSGIESSFCSLLSLLKTEFRTLNLGSLPESQRIELARHFVQRTRRDIQRDWKEEHCFPERISVDETYTLSQSYRRLFEQAYNFCCEIIKTGQTFEERKRRVRYWGVLALLRCVMSSPAAAVAALEKRVTDHTDPHEEDADFTPSIFEASEDITDDETPRPPIERAEATLPASEQRRLRELARFADSLCHSPQDTKLTRCVEVVRDLLQKGENN